MEFDEIKKIWDSQNNEPIYGINEKALHNRILSKKKKAHHIANLSELFAVIAYIAAGSMILIKNLSQREGTISFYVLSAWMFVSVLYLLMSRLRRMKDVQQFERSMHGDLDHAISVATYQVRLSGLIRWNTVPLAVLIVLGILESGKSIWIALALVIFFVLTNYAAGWEHNLYKSRKRELEILKTKLESE